ncbi:hypothetical protein RGQ13_07495 [Thalassotalea psychrophila]|uniref:DUF4345 domain-containing protein n=1 Tax=Thalassotalea psychrophila TaxID=3065647 RepID=A0ABY9TZ14_9GAMM|nr:hypothetical protein RGQ13_07495 [Colwelliaceae bacterium SQ149]
MTLFINTGRALALLGVLFFTAIFLKVFFQFDVLPGFSYLSSYLMSFSGALLLAWGVLMIKTAEQKEFVPIVAYTTGVMLVLSAIMRIVAIFVAPQTFEFLPTIIAQIIPITESGLFITLGVIFLTRYKN